MGCSYSHTNQEQFNKDLSDLNRNNNNEQGSQIRSKSNTIEKMINPHLITKLNRGGLIVKTGVGPIQFGLPPETVKDSLLLGVEVPSYYIIPTERFDKKFGINVAEFEFPAYFNFFLKKRQITLICDQQTAESIKVVFQETLLGPTDFTNIHQDYHPDVDPSEYVDFAKELAIFAKNPMNPTENLTSDTLLKFEIFKDNVVEIKGQDTVVKVQRQELEFCIYENDKLLTKLTDEVKFPPEYEEYIEIHMPDDQWKSERVPPSLSVIQQLREGKKPPSLTQKFVEDEDELLKKSELSQQEFKEQPRPSVLLWNEQGTPQVSGGSVILDDSVTFTPPDFGVTVLGCSHGFDPKGSTSGYIFWINGRGIMVDPPPYTSYHLKKIGIPPVMISAIIISHCHADHDAGVLHKILDTSKVEIITTRTIMYSFLRKYSAITGLPVETLKSLFNFRPAIIGCALNIFGATFQFHYAFHSIPSLGFRVQYQNKSIYFSSDTFYDPQKIQEYTDKGWLSPQRCKQLTQVKFDEDVILHEAGIPPIHTPQTILAQLPTGVKNRMYLVHVAAKDILKDSGLKVARAGIENTLILIRPIISTSISWARKMDLISKIDIFEKLQVNNVKWLMDALSLETFKEGQLVVEENQGGNKFYIIESGLAKVFTKSKGRQFERYLQVGDYFGESALIQEGKRKASVIAVTDIRVLMLEKHDFWFIFGDGFEGSGPIIEQMMHLMQARQQQAIHILFKNSQCSRFTPSQKTQLEMIMHEQTVKKKQVMWRAGEKANFAFFVKKGCFSFFDCPEEDLLDFDSGAFIGEISALLSYSELTTSVKALKDGVVFLIKRSDLVDFLNRNPGLLLSLREVKYIE